MSDEETTGRHQTPTLETRVVQLETQRDGWKWAIGLLAGTALGLGLSIAGHQIDFERDTAISIAENRRRIEALEQGARDSDEQDTAVAVQLSAVAVELGRLRVTLDQLERRMSQTEARLDGARR